MKKNLIFLVVLVLASCQSQTNSNFSELGSFPNNLEEISGIIYVPSDKNIWAVQDSGNENKIYNLDLEGNVIQTIVVEDAVNIDWEDITKDQQGNLYIGDFGNNKNKRTDLGIYKIDHDQLHKSSLTSSYRINFSYPEQLDFPPEKKALFFDVEGFFELNNYFYLFTKNRSKNFDGTTYIYKIENAPGTQLAVKVGELITCNQYDHCVITSAAISPNKKSIALLSHDQVFLFTDVDTNHFMKGQPTIIALNHFSQKESVSFKDNSTLLIADERTKKIGGKLYELKLN